MIDTSIFSYCHLSGLLRWREPPHPRFHKGQIAGHIGCSGYIRVGVAGKDYPAHKIAWLMHYGVWPKEQIDHKNRDKSDNRISNLRLATPVQNGANRGLQKNNSSGYKGVSLNKRTGRWQAMIKIEGKQKNLGSFDRPEEAYAVYQRKAKEVHGEFSPE